MSKDKFWKTFRKPEEPIAQDRFKSYKRECFEDNIKKCSWVETFIEDCLLETFLWLSRLFCLQSSKPFRRLSPSQWKPKESLTLMQ